MSRKADKGQARILEEIRFGFLHPYKVAGMAEPWYTKMAETHRLLVSRGIGAILTLTEDSLYGDLHRAAGFIHQHEPVNDTEPPTSKGMDRAIAFIDGCIEKDVGVAIHCQEGRGRTGTVLCGWIGLRESLPPKKAIKRTLESRRETILTPCQRSFLHEYLDR